MQRVRTKGFSLIELMIAIAIIGVLLRLALPGYQKYVARTNRTEATQFLVDLANRQQQYLMDARQYATSLTALNITAVPTRFGESYDLTITTAAGPPPTFTLTATPKGAQAKQDGTTAITIDEKGNRAPADKWK